LLFLKGKLSLDGGVYKIVVDALPGYVVPLSFPTSDLQSWAASHVGQDITVWGNWDKSDPTVFVVQSANPSWVRLLSRSSRTLIILTVLASVLGVVSAAISRWVPNTPRGVGGGSLYGYPFVWYGCSLPAPPYTPVCEIVSPTHLLLDIVVWAIVWGILLLAVQRLIHHGDNAQPLESKKILNKNVKT
jgi:hypothetical protein